MLVEALATQEQFQSELASNYIEHGVAVCRGVFDEADTSVLRAWWQDTRSKIVDGSLKRSGIHIAQPRLDDQFFHNLHLHPKLLDIARSCLGNDLCHYLTRLLVKDELAVTDIGCHQDWPYFNGNTKKLAIMIAVTRCTEANGKLYFIMDSHHFGTLTRGTIDHVRYPELPHIGPDLEPGDIVLHDFLTWHYSVKPQIIEDRAMIQVVYQPSTDASSKQLISGRMLNPYYCHNSSVPMAEIDPPIYAVTAEQARDRWHAGDKTAPYRLRHVLVDDVDVTSFFSAHALLAEVALEEQSLTKAREHLEQARLQYAALGKSVERLEQALAERSGAAQSAAAGGAALGLNPPSPQFDENAPPASGAEHGPTVVANLQETAFAIDTWSNSGSKWVSDCLNLHPLVRAYCCDRQLVGGRSDLSALEYMAAIIRHAPADHPVRGEVHGISHPDFHSLVQAYGDSFRGAHLVAHPVTQLGGSFAFSQKLGRQWGHSFFRDFWGVPRGSDLSETVLAVLGEDGDHVPAHYLGHVNLVTMIANPQGPVKWPLFRLEELMRSDAEWISLVRHISRGLIDDYGAAWRPMRDVYVGVAHEVFQAEDPKAVWRDFPEYVRQLFSALLMDEARATYEAIGYDLSFIPRPSRLNKHAWLTQEARGKYEALGYDLSLIPPPPQVIGFS